MADSDATTALNAFGRLVGKWKMTGDEGSAEQYEAQGFNWAMRKLLLAAKPTLEYSLTGLSFKTSTSIVGINLPDMEFFIGAAGPTSTAALGRVSEVWYSVDENGKAAAFSKVYLTKQEQINGTPSYTCKYSWNLSPDNSAITIEIITQIQAEPNVISRAHFKRIGGEPLLGAKETPVVPVVDSQPEALDRSTRSLCPAADAVAILALIRSPEAPDAVDTLIVQQYRPPVDAVTVELPAGLIDPGEAPEVAALRELKEETGYVGSAAYCSGPLAMSPGLCDETCHLVVVEVDLSNPINHNPTQQLEDTEFIKVTRVPVHALHEKILALEKDEGCIAIQGLHLLSFGLQLGLLGGRV